MRKMFSEKQIEEMIKKPIEELGLSKTDGVVNVDSNLHVDGVITSVPEMEITIYTKQQLEDKIHLTLPDVNVEGFYSAIKVINRVMYVVISGRVRNFGASDVSFDWASFIGQTKITLPEEIASKIYDLQGNPVSADSTPEGILKCDFIYGRNNNRGIFRLTHSAQNEINFAEINSSLTLNANDFSEIELRFFLTL